MPAQESKLENPTGASSSGWERLALRRLLEYLEQPPVTVRLWDGFELRPEGKAPIGRMTFTDQSSLRRTLLSYNVGFGDAFSAGLIKVEGKLPEVLEAFYVKQPNGKFSSPLLQKLSNRPRLNTLEGSKQNIHHHYDIGNDFYRLWLDEEMQYTCAYFPDRSLSLEQAQQAKLDHICRKLQLKPDDRVVEAGCGWGGLARHMAIRYGAEVRAYNISRRQVEYARERAKREGYTDRVEYVADDYRNIDGEYDAFVSVGMLEHVGADNYRELGGVVDRCLAPRRRGLIHTIGRNRPRLMNPWIEKRIFPGAYPPTIKEMMEIFEPFCFSVLDIENLRLHYALTMEHWLQRFDRHEAEITDMFDDSFMRTWRLYLAGSIAAFRVGELQLFQTVFARSNDNSVPWSREHLYPRSPE